MKVPLNQIATVEVEVDDEELAGMLEHKAAEICGNPDDVGCDWFIDRFGNTYIADANWLISSNPVVAEMISIAWRLRGYQEKSFVLSDDQIRADPRTGGALERAS